MRESFYYRMIINNILAGTFHYAKSSLTRPFSGSLSVPCAPLSLLGSSSSVWVGHSWATAQGAGYKGAPQRLPLISAGSLSETYTYSYIP